MPHFNVFSLQKGLSMERPSAAGHDVLYCAGLHIVAHDARLALNCG